jgi:hypothetical protein
MKIAMFFGVINTRGAISLELIPYIECSQNAQHGLNNHFGHGVVDIHSFHCGCGTMDITRYENSDVFWSY